MGNIAGFVLKFNDDVVIKSVYDPSPVGYSLPASNAFTGFTTTGQNANATAQWNIKGSFDKGYYFYTKPNKKGGTNFFSACSYRITSSGALYDIYLGGCYWTSGLLNTINCIYLGLTSNVVYPLHRNYRAYGFAIRSAEEKVLKCGLKKLQIVCNFGENCNITTLKIRIFII